MSFLKNTAKVGGMTIISRITGYVRDIFLASLLGANIWNDIFVLALRLPNLFRSVFGEGAFNNAFVPIFAKKLAICKDEAFVFAGQVQTLLLLSLLIFSGFMLYNMHWLVLITTPGMKSQPQIIEMISELTQITFPYLIFISLAAFYGGVLNAQGKFTAFAFMPVLFNLILIITCLLLRTNGFDAVRILAWAVLAAGVCELLFMLLFTHILGQTIALRKPQWTDDTRMMFRRLMPGIVGSGVMHINLWVDTMLASFVSNGISYLYYADRINQLPLAIIGTALGTVLLPALAKTISESSNKHTTAMQNQALKLGLFVAIPSAFGLVLLAPEIVALLFERGNFDNVATIQTARALQIISLALPAYVITKIFLALFYAHGDTKTPVILGSCCIIINIIASLLLMPFMQHAGIAAATVISAWFNCLSLLAIAYKRNWYTLDFKLFIHIMKYVLASFLMIIPAFFGKNLLPLANDSTLSTISVIMLSMFCYLLTCYAIKVIPIKK